MDFFDVSEKLKLFESTQLVWFKSYIPYARVLIPELFPEIDKAIYMDIDIIVNCDIKELWNVDLSRHCGLDAQSPENREYALAAAEGYKDDFAIEHYGISPNHKYFNNGLLVMNCQKWREEHIAEKLLKIAAESKFKFRYPTQDVFNIFFDHNNYLAFDWKYNYMPKYNKDIEKPKIIHYCWDKPWENRDCGFSEYFWRIAEKTPYYEFFREKLRKNMAAKSNFAAELRKKIK
jgi:lipopolysaccharide biosynthesis glycosyltransferase